jgi:hypothetical protein
MLCRRNFPQFNLEQNGSVHIGYTSIYIEKEGARSSVVG